MDYHKTTQKSLQLKITRDHCPRCVQAESEGFFSNLNKLKLGPKGFLNSGTRFYNKKFCPQISCSFVEDQFDKDHKMRTFNMTRSAEGWIPDEDTRKVTIQNVQDFCDRFISENEEIPQLVPIGASVPNSTKVSTKVLPTSQVNTGMTVKESLFCCIVFMMKDERETSSKKIFHELLPQSVISVRRMIGDLDLLGKVTTSLELLDYEFWRSDKDQARGVCGPSGCMGQPDKCRCFTCTPTTHTPIENNCIVLRITGDLLQKLPEEVYNNFKLTKGPRNNTLRTVTLTSEDKHVIETKKYAAVPCLEAYEILVIAKRRAPNLTINEICGENKEFAYGFSRYNRTYTDFVEVQSHAPRNSLCVFEVDHIKSTTTTHSFEFTMIVSDLEVNLGCIEKFLNDVATSKPVKAPFNW